MDCKEFDKLIRDKNINFLIGSGASTPMYPTLSLGNNRPSFEDVVSNSKISDLAKKIMYVYYFLKYILPMNGKLHEQKIRIILK